ncbi:MAG: histidine kinase [Rhizobacter sp.]|nr:histidine kinase [Ferruginibacter sp.]
MLLPTILAIIILGNLRKNLRKAGLFSKWEKFFWGFLGLFIACIVVYSSLSGSRLIVEWASFALVAALLYIIYTQKDLASAKPLSLAFLPLFALNFIEAVIRFIDKPFYEDWDNYFDIGELFAMVWMIAMLIINSRQRKALEKERQKNEEKEKEYRITEKVKAELEVQVRERTAELTQQKEELQQTLNELKDTQTQLIQSEKMASLGELTAGIAHEIQNPLNFVNNFSEINTELIAEIKVAITKGDFEEVRSLADDIADNEEKINHHGKRADAIVKGMLQHSRNSSGQKEPTNINALADEYFRLAYHGLRAKDKSFNATLKTDYDEKIGEVNILPQDMGRVILNLITNAFYAVTEKKRDGIQGYEPTVTVKTLMYGQQNLQVTVSDNGKGIPPKVMEKIFLPFFTTKPTGQGTGLGLSMSYDIVTKGHGGTLTVDSKEGEGSTFIISLPI